MSLDTHTLIIGASAAGLSCAAQLKRRGVSFEIIESQSQVGYAWRNHYHRLHLHTNKSSSSLPFMKFGKSVPKYPSRMQVLEYLEEYCVKNNIKPRFNTSASRIYKDQEYWITETEKEKIRSGYLIICTGNTNRPKLAKKLGLESFPGRLLHSSEYKNGSEFTGQRVLIVGFGNSACEIAICLHEHGAFPSMSVRNPVNVIPRDILGIPVLQLGILLSGLPPKLADTMNKPLMNLLIGNIEKHGLKKLPYGPLEQIAKDHSIPLLDIGTMDLIRKGEVKIYGDIESIKGNLIYFENSSEQFDAIIMATGYQKGLEQFIDLSPERIEDLSMKMTKRKYFGKDNLYFCGFYVAPTGMLREIRNESEQIVNAIFTMDQT